MREGGESGFFKNDNRRGHYYKLVLEALERMQGYLNEGKNNSEIARLEGVSEGAIRHAIKNMKISKKGNSSASNANGESKQSFECKCVPKQSL